MAVTVKKIDEKEKWKIRESEKVKVKRCGNIVEATYTSARSNGCHILNLDKERYINLTTGEVKQTYDIYGESLRRATQLKILRYNPMEQVDKVKHIRKIGKALNSRELENFLVKINASICRRVFLFYLYTGARRSEALTVKWQDIDFEHNRITLHGTKTDKALRTIPLLPELRDLLKTMPRTGKEYIFPHAPDYVTREFKTLCPAHKLHDLRHTFATRCLECGISIKVLQLWLGHSRLETTSSIYVHVLDSFNRSEADKFRLF